MIPKNVQRTLLVFFLFRMTELSAFLCELMMKMFFFQKLECKSKLEKNSGVSVFFRKIETLIYFFWDKKCFQICNRKPSSLRTKKE